MKRQTASPTPPPSKAPGPAAAPGPVSPGDLKRAERIVEGAKAKALTEWRRMDLRPLEAALRRAERPVADVLPTVLGRLRIEQRQSESQIVEVWRRTIDPVVTAHAQPVGLAKGTLFVAVDSSPWLSEIVRYRRREILEKLQLAVGRDVIQKISFRIG